MKENGKFIHELEGERQTKRYIVRGNTPITNYRTYVSVDDNVYVSFEEAKNEALRRLVDRIQGLEEELRGCKQDLLDLGKEKP